MQGAGTITTGGCSAAAGGAGNRESRERQRSRKTCVCMVSDFFYPGLGGVEMHIVNLALCLIDRGFKVVAVTHHRGTRHGIRFMKKGLKTYYLPQVPFYDNVTFPTIWSGFALFRQILIREGVDIVHGHQATSSLTHECMLHARTMGLKIIYTDHSLFGFDDAACIHVNKVLKVFLSDVDHSICVSHTNKENLVLRAALNPDNVSVIPNSLDSDRFTPISSECARQRDPAAPTLVVLSRLTYRKGVDLLVEVIPAVCRRHPSVRWIVGGDGPKRIILEEMKERYDLHDRVELLGAVAHDNVAAVLRRGDIFVNASLTEAFCIAILEAASCGLLVVSTAVGGVLEVLPPHMIRLSYADPAALTQTVSGAVEELGGVDRSKYHGEVRGMYSWQNVAERTASVYECVLRSQRVSLLTRLSYILTCGPVAGKMCCVLAVFHCLLWLLLEWLYPGSEIETAPDATEFSKELSSSKSSRPCAGGRHTQ
eukprot:GHVU01152556.1.p1 GENE.GHVU01152556.1~~GHVU01152556.1.p1  ORF type:complete len:482 (-),score=72.17 GHVU01152556.1:208-1653(-)